MRDDEEQGTRLDDEDVDDVAGGGGAPFEQSAPGGQRNVSADFGID